MAASRGCHLGLYARSSWSPLRLTGGNISGEPTFGSLPLPTDNPRHVERLDYLECAERAGALSLARWRHSARVRRCFWLSVRSLSGVGVPTRDETRGERARVACSRLAVALKLPSNSMS